MTRQDVGWDRARVESSNAAGASLLRHRGCFFSSERPGGVYHIASAMPCLGDKICCGAKSREQRYRFSNGSGTFSKLLEQKPQIYHCLSFFNMFLWKPRFSDEENHYNLAPVTWGSIFS